MLSNKLIYRVACTVVIPTYGRMNEQLLKHVSTLIAVGMQVVIVDDNDSTSTFRLKNLSNFDKFNSEPLFKYVPLEKNSGACIARNIGVQNADSDVIAFLDDDDTILIAEFIRKVSFFRAVISDYDICVSDMIVKRGEVLYNTHFSKFRGLDSTSYLLNGNCYSPMIMVKKEYYLSIGGFFPAKKYQDYVFMLRCFLSGCNLIHYARPTFIHHEHSGTRITNSGGSYAERFRFEADLLSDLKDTNIGSSYEKRKIHVKFFHDTTCKSVSGKLVYYIGIFSCLRPYGLRFVLKYFFLSIVPNYLLTKIRFWFGYKVANIMEEIS